MKCPICEEGELKKKMIEEILFGVSLGKFPAKVCSSCGESFTDEETTKKIEHAAKEKGIWGLEKKTKITRSGNSLAIRIPKQMANYLQVREGQEVYIHPEKDRIIIEKK